MLVSAATVVSESEEPGLDPGGDKTPGLVAVMGLEPVRGLAPANKRGQTKERVEGGSLAEAALL